MGARIPAGVPATEPIARALPGSADRGVHGQRYAARAARHYRAVAASRAAQAYRQLSAAEPELYRARKQFAHAGRAATASGATRERRQRDRVRANDRTGGRDR